MAEFTKQLQTDDGEHITFSFHKIYTVKGIIYFVTAFRNHLPINLHMESRDGSWHIVKAPRPPQWVLTHEEVLAKCIMDNQG